MLRQEPKVRVMQLVDSLQLGGTEKMAVLIANELSGQVGFESYLYVTHAGGQLVHEVNNKVALIQGDKSSFFDLLSFLKLLLAIRKNKIHILHAHSSSLVWASCIKLFCFRRVFLVWHIHHGAIDKLTSWEIKILSFAAKAVNDTIVVNSSYISIAIERFNIKKEKISYIPNFTNIKVSKSEVINWNVGERIKIIMIANLRPQKDFDLLIDVVKLLKTKNLNFIVRNYGFDLNDSYAKYIKKRVLDEQLDHWLQLCGPCNDIATVAAGANIAILTSESEGLPLTLLEYGLMKIPVVSTNVGECKSVLLNGEGGILVDAKNAYDFVEAILWITSNVNFAQEMANNLYFNVIKSHSKEGFMKRLLIIYSALKG